METVAEKSGRTLGSNDDSGDSSEVVLKRCEDVPWVPPFGPQLGILCLVSQGYAKQPDIVATVSIFSTVAKLDGGENLSHELRHCRKN